MGRMDIQSTPDTAAALAQRVVSVALGNEDMLVIVDPMSTGATLAFEAAKLGLKICCVWSDVCPESLRHFVADGMAIDFVGEVHHRGDLKATCHALTQIGTVCNVIVGSEPGVELADEISTALGLRSNGLQQSNVRRNKFLQSEAVRAAGLSAGGQMLVSSAREVETFIRDYCTPFTRAVVKPVDGAASEGVTICTSAEQMRKAFKALQGTVNVFGRANRQVLLMEYLGGDEYVVDTVSRDGVHKCVAIWKYIKQPLNGVPNVFYGQRLMQVNPADKSDVHMHMAAYIFGVLDAIGIRHGAVHSEVKYEASSPRGLARGPVLIETNCRLHGIEGSWKPIVDKCLGYSQVSVLLDAYHEQQQAFSAIPPTPSTFLAHGAQVGVRSTVEGTITRINEARLSNIRSVQSYCGENLPLTTTLAAGQPIAKTVDIITLCGQINLAHASKVTLEADLAYVQTLIDQGLFEVSDPITEIITEVSLDPNPANVDARKPPKTDAAQAASPPASSLAMPPLMRAIQTLLAGFCLPTCLGEAAPGLVKPADGSINPSIRGSADGSIRGLFDNAKPLTPKHQRSRALRLSH